MPEFPTIAHLAMTVRDLEESAPWYERLFDARPVIDEDTGPFHHVVWLLGGQILFALNQFANPVKGSKFDERQVAWITSHSRAPIALRLNSGGSG